MIPYEWQWFGHEPLKRTPVVLQMDADAQPIGPVLTDRSGVAAVDLPPGSGKVLVSGVERFHGRLTARSRSTLVDHSILDDLTGAPACSPQ